MDKYGKYSKSAGTFRQGGFIERTSVSHGVRVRTRNQSSCLEVLVAGLIPVLVVVLVVLAVIFASTILF